MTPDNFYPTCNFHYYSDHPPVCRDLLEASNLGTNGNSKVGLLNSGSLLRLNVLRIDHKTNFKCFEKPTLCTGNL